MSAPVLNISKDNRKQFFFIDELYFGDSSSTELWRPSVGDGVIDLSIGIYRVIEVSDDGIPTLDLVNRFSYASNFNQDSTSLITSISQYNPSVSHRIFMYEDVIPNSLTVDGHYLCYGSEPAYMVFFQGTSVTDQTKIISEVYNSSGNLLGYEVPLESVQLGADTAKRPVTFNTTRNLLDGEVITCVAYKANGGVYSTETFRVVRNNALRPSSLTTRTIVGIHLESEMLDTVDKTLILNNVGVPIDSAYFSAMLEYDDASQVKVTIDGVKTKLVGIDGYDSSVVGAPTQLTLSYRPSASEPYINGGGSINNPVITSTYKMANIATANSYNLKVFMTTAWNESTSSYNYKYYLLNLEGDLFIDVTSKVTVSFTSGGVSVASNSLDIEMIALVSLNMNDVAPSAYPNYIHTQSIIVRNASPGSSTYNTLLSYNQRYSTYGADTYGIINVSNKTINVSLYDSALDLNSTNYDTWLNVMYATLEPMYDNQVLQGPAAPTGFEIKFNGETSGIQSMTAWNSEIDISSFSTLPIAKGVVEVVWHRQTIEGDLIIAVSPLFVKF